MIAPHPSAVGRLDEIPRIWTTTAQAIIAEIGIDAPGGMECSRKSGGGDLCREFVDVSIS